MFRIFRFLRRHAAPPDPWDPWSDVLKREKSTWERARRDARSGPRVLIAPGAGGFHVGVLLESAMAVGLTLRGARTDILLCDSLLPSCLMTEIVGVSPEGLRESPPQPRCAKCVSRGRGLFRPLGLDVHWLGGLVSEAKRREALEISRALPIEGVGDYRLEGMAVGEHAVAGALRYFARGDFEGEPHAEVMIRHYLLAALLTVFGVDELLDRHRYDVACFNHGIYVPQGLIGEVCRRRGVRVVNWNPAYRKSSFIFSHGDSYHHTMISEPTSDWENLAWTEKLERDVMGYLYSRRTGKNDWIWFHDEPQEDAEKIAREIGLSFSKPTIALLTNVMWDAQLHYKSNAFPSMLAWVLETIRYFARRPEIQLAIRVHPAELRGGIPSRQFMAEEVRKAFPQLPPNVALVAPESQVSTYALADHSNAVLIYNTKTGIEVSSMGIPVIVAGEAWIRGKGFSLDATSPESYLRLLDLLPLEERLSPEQLRRARKYAYHFFFRRMIPLPFIGQTDKRKGFFMKVDSLDIFRPGRSKSLDVICGGVLKETPFNYPAETEGQEPS